jgi:hypothetical protein
MIESCIVSALIAPLGRERAYARKQTAPKVSLNESFMIQFLTHPYFGNSAEEFHLHETLSISIKLLSSLTSLIQCHISTFNADKTLMKLH